jgi:hypothetical protein
MYITDPLKLLQKMLEEYYRQYRSGEISEKEYCIRAKPLDEEIGRLEMSTLRDTPVLKGSSLLHSRELKN